MALGKLLELGGIDNSPSKAKQDTGKFRVARNVYPTPDNRLIPRYHNSEVEASVTDKKCYHHIAQYDDTVLSLVSQYSMFSGNYVYALYRDSEKIPRSSDISASPFLTRTDDCPQQVQYQRITNTAYYLSPYDSTLFKYDGVELSYAGVHQPIFSCSQGDPLGTKYVRVLQNRFDFEGNVDYSEDIMFKVLAATNSIQVRVDGGATNILKSFAVSPYPVLGLGIVTPKIANDIYYKCTKITYYNTPPATAVAGEIYVNLADNKAYIGEGSAYTLIYEGSRLTYPTINSFPSVGEYQTIYRDASNGKLYRWSVAEGIGIAYNNLASFPPSGTSGVEYYCAKDTGLIYRFFGGSYTLYPNAGKYIEIVAGSTIDGGHYQFSSNDFTILSFDTNITQENIGSYIAVRDDFTNDMIADTVGLPGTTIGLVTYKIKEVQELISVTGKVKLVTLDALDVKYSNDLGTGFKTSDINRYSSSFLSEPGARDTYFLKGGRTFFSIWGSLSDVGDFFQKRFCFSFPESTIRDFVTVDVTSATMTITSVKNPIVTSAILGEVYDVDNPPISLNENAPQFYGINSGIYCMTSYAGVLYFASDSYIFASNPYLPRKIGMINQNGVYLIGDYEDGRYTSLCGTNEFLLISRERKNYYVTGNIVTGNFRIQNITEAEVGSWGNSTSISIKDSVIFLTAKGIYQTIEGGKTTLISSKCPKNFALFDSINTNEDVSFKITGLSSNPVTSTLPDNSISLAYDEYRDLLVFMQKGIENSCLVLSMKTSEFYEWDGLMKDYQDQYANCIAFIRAEYLLGGISTEDDSAKIVKEDKESALGYVPTNPVKLYTTWLTAGEPSLEKLLLQLKIFGRIQSNGNTSSISVCHYKDWNLNTKITNSFYFPKDTSLSLNDQTQYSHKKRFNSDKILSASVGIEVNTIPVTFEIESMEVELNAIQEGMKR